MSDGAKTQPIEPGLLARAAAGLRYAFTGKAPSWFGPSAPLPPMAPPEVRGRPFDFPVGYNLSVRPRGEYGENAIDHATLRAVADPGQGGLDLLRLAIETRKDQMAGQEWVIRGRDGTDGGKRARDIESALRYPDGVRSFRTWQRMLLEDLLVIDAPTVYLAPQLGSKDKRPDVMDGALLKPLLDVNGRTPMPPVPAYQQVLKGVPAVDYTLDEIVRAPRNLRSHRVYGMSPVEQVVMTVNIALRRQVSQLEFYTAGSVPDVVFGVPETWSTAQVAEFQAYWDALLSGDTAQRRRARFVPGGVKPYPLKDPILKDLFDEWLARIICFAFSLSPQTLVKEMNRATAEQSSLSAKEEGLEPIKLWWKDTVDEVLLKGFGEADLEYAYKDEEIADPAQKAKVFQIATGGKAWVTADEARAAHGMKPLTPEQKDELSPPPPPQLEAFAGGKPGAKPGEKPDENPDGPDAAKVAKARRVLRPYGP